jgi:hypothetical protein
MRIDGPAFRGRPLGHRLDPLRSEPYLLDPETYAELVHRLLDVHGFEELGRMEPAAFGLGPDERAEFFIGRLFSTYEFLEPMLGEFGTSDAAGFRIEAPLESVQGVVAVLIHADVNTSPRGLSPDIEAQLRSDGCSRLLVFANVGSDDAGYFGAGRQSTSLACMPQRLGSLAFNILTATNVWLEFRHRLDWKIKNFLWAQR